MSDISSGETFSDVTPDNAVNAQRLNNAINASTINPAFISGKSSITPVAADLLPFYDASGGVIGQAQVDAMATAMGVKAVGTTAGTVAAGDDTRFPSSVTGVRKGAGAGSNDSAAVSSDYAQAPTALVYSAGAVSANCALNTNFTAAFPATTTACTITFNNFPDGAKIRIYTTQGGTSASTLTTTCYSGNGSGLLTVVRPGGAGAVTASTNATDLVILERFGSIVIKTFSNNFS